MFGAKTQRTKTCFAASTRSRSRQGQTDAPGAGLDMHNAREAAAKTLRETERMIQEELDAL
jgi:hypothetical protein